MSESAREGVEGGPLSSVQVAPDFDAFYGARWREVARWAAVLCGSVHEGEEAAQEAFLRVADRYDDLEQPEAYLRATLVNTVREMHRASSRRRARELRAVGDDERAGPVLDSLGDPDVFRALLLVRWRKRAVLVLRYWADWDESSIAEALGCRPSTVRSLARRGLTELRSELEDSHG